MPVSSYCQNGELILRADFNKKRELKKWRGKKSYKLEKQGDDNRVLHITNKTDQQDRLFTYALPMEKVRGTKLDIKVRFKAENVSVSPIGYKGIKVMIHATMPYADIWPQLQIGAGSFDWRDLGFQATVPSGATDALLVLGLEGVSGDIWFDNVEVRIAEPVREKPAAPAPVMYKGHDQPRLRGAMVPTFMNKEDLKVLAGWGANLVRWQLTWNGFPNSVADVSDFPAYERWLNGALSHLDTMLPLCRELGIKVVIDLHTPPGGRSRDDKILKIFLERHWQESFRKVWRDIAARYRDEPAVWAYDLVNEPIEGALTDSLLSWRQLAIAALEDIRKIDSTHAIIMEAAPNGSPDALAELNPLPYKNVVYSFHMYEPSLFTHQGPDSTGQRFTYPGVIMNKMWDKNALRQMIKPVADWQKDYNAHIYIGEFSAIRWADGAYEYMRDCIELFEELGWDWSYHAFREWSGWSIEHDSNPQNEQPAAELTDRQKLFMEWFAKNRN